ncbi:MAG: sigma-70 family RNA polymerase sigma factor [Planctomycetota bacterium]|nr:MAG: sigma-70 family RNA polymerase sigma factor [Planctomycetota bacterium]
MATTPGNASVSIELVRKAQGGDFSALDRLFERYYPRVLRIVNVRLGRELARYVESEDILQETFIAAVNAFDQFEMRDESSLIVWLSKIAENQIRRVAAHEEALKRDRYRERALRHVQDSHASGDIVYDPEDPLRGPLEGLALEEDIATIEECLQEMSMINREVLLLRFYADATWEQVAEELELTSSVAARSRSARALTDLARRLHKRRTLGD